jgi:cytoskeletal protein RodZ
VSERDQRLRELCDQLRQIRESKAITLDEASSRTRIRVPLLEALEAGRMEELPGLVYARGFLRTYLNFLDVPHLWEEFDEVLPQPETEGLGNVIGSTAPPAKGFRKISRAWLYLLLALGVAAALFVVWQKRDEVRPVPPVPPAEMERTLEELSEDQPSLAVLETETDDNEEMPAVVVSAEPEDLAVVALSPDRAEPVLPGRVSDDLSPDIAWLRELSVDVAPLEEAVAADVLRIVGRGACWVRISQGESVLYQGTLQQGDQRTFEIDGDTRIRIGNAANLDVHWRDESWTPLSSRADVATYRVRPGHPLERL